MWSVSMPLCRMRLAATLRVICCFVSGPSRPPCTQKTHLRLESHVLKAGRALPLIIVCRRPQPLAPLRNPRRRLRAQESIPSTSMSERKRMSLACFPASLPLSFLLTLPPLPFSPHNIHLIYPRLFEASPVQLNWVHTRTALRGHL